MFVRAGLLLAFITVNAVLPRAASAAVRHVVFVDAGRSGGAGTRDQPFATIRQAVAAAGNGGVIYVAEAAAPYEEIFALRKGQMLIGSAFGLEAVRAEYHVDLDAPIVAAMKGTGPVIHGSISVAGDNVVAGCTVVADRKTGPAIVASSPDGTVKIRSMWIRTSQEAFALYCDRIAAPVSWSGGGIEATAAGSGIVMTNVSANVTFDRVPLSGDFATALMVRGMSNGTMSFSNGAPIRISSATRDAISIADAQGGAVRFDSPLTIRTAQTAAFVVHTLGRLTISGGQSWIESGGTAVDIHDTTADVTLDRISVTPSLEKAPAVGVVLDKVKGRFDVSGDGETAGSGGTITNALSYGIRVTQSSGIHLRNMSVVGGGSVDSREVCPSDIPRQTNLGCRAGIFLRHVDQSAFANLSVESTAAVGLNANNLGEVKFTALRIANSGSRDTEPALLLDEVQGSVTFERCMISNGRGGAARIEQQFNRGGRVIFDRCEIEAAAVPAPFLIRVASSKSARIGVTLLNTRLHDNAGGGIEASASGSSTTLLLVRDSYFGNLSRSAIAATGDDHATVVMAASGNRLSTPANTSGPVIDISLRKGGVACIDLTGNDIAAAVSPVIAIGSDSPAAALRLVGAATAEELSKVNGGAAVRIVGVSPVNSPRCD